MCVRRESPSVKLALALCLVVALAAPPAVASDGGGSGVAAAAVGGDAYDLQSNEQLRNRIRELEAGLAEVQKKLLVHLTASGANASGANASGGDAIANPSAPGVGGKHFKDKLVEAFKRFKLVVAQFLEPILLSHTMFVASIVLILQWHIRFHFRECLHNRMRKWFPSRVQIKPMLAWRKLGVNILILGIYYDTTLGPFLDWIVKNRPFVSSIGLVFFDNVVVYYSFMALAFCFDRHFGKGKKGWKDPIDETVDDGIQADRDSAQNVYEDLTIKFQRVIPIWIVQIMLVAFYIEELNADKDTKNLDKVDFVNWVVATLFTMYAGDSQVGEGFSSEYWRLVLDFTSAEEAVKEAVEKAKRVSTGASVPLQDLEEAEADEQLLKKAFQDLGNVPHHYARFFPGCRCWPSCLRMTLKREWYCRCMMDFTVNSMARSVILYTVPIMVCVEGPLDFVKDLTAVMFITMLDDLEGGDSRDMKEILIKLKFREFLRRSARALHSQESDRGFEDSSSRSQTSCIPLLEEVDINSSFQLTEDEKNHLKDPKTDLLERMRDVEHWTKFHPAGTNDEENQEP